MDTLLITGSNGLLGAKLIQQTLGSYNVVGLSQRPCSNRYLGAFQFYQADIRDQRAVSAVVSAVRPQVVVHTAAMTNVDACELRPEEAWAVNVVGAEHLARAAREAGAYLIFLSTDYVFAGDQGPYGESDPSQPLSVYGKTKLAAEVVAAAQCPDSCIARTSTLYGYTPTARPNFVTWLIGELRAGNPVTAVTDQVTSPTLADNLAEMLLAMAAKHLNGLYHAAGSEWLSRYDFALHIARCFDLKAGLIHPGDGEALRQAAPRPRHSGLVTRCVAEDTGVQPLPVHAGLLVMRRQMEAPVP